MVELVTSDGVPCKASTSPAIPYGASARAVALAILLAFLVARTGLAPVGRLTHQAESLAARPERVGQAPTERIVRQAAEAHGGSVSATNAPAGGLRSASPSARR